jgi:hypothetical protein
MCKFGLLFLFSFTAFSHSLDAAQSAQVWLVCLSPRFQTATANVLGQTQTLELGTAEGADGLNGELTPTFEPTLPSHGTSFRWTDPTFPEPMTGDLVMDVPAATDNNQNGFPDFFEVQQAVAGEQTQGLYAGAVDDGEVSAAWSRAEGSSMGTCRLTLTSSMFGELPEFTAQFELIEYTGTLDYLPGATNVAGTIHLLRTETPANTLAGPIAFSRAGTNRFDEFNLEAGAWTNAAGQTLTFTNSTVFRDTALDTNYFALVGFDDGDLQTSAPDYLVWQISIDDANDIDQDGIPDLSDDLPGIDGERPVLGISLANDRAQLQISGQAGQTYEVEETASLREPNWTLTLAVTLNSPVQTVELPVAGRSTVFWRVKAR